MPNPYRSMPNPYGSMPNPYGFRNFKKRQHQNSLLPWCAFVGSIKNLQRMVF